MCFQAYGTRESSRKHRLYVCMYTYVFSACSGCIVPNQGKPAGRLQRKNHGTGANFCYEQAQAWFLPRAMCPFGSCDAQMNLHDLILTHRYRLHGARLTDNDDGADDLT
jgi:hypothetical protein